MTVGRIPSVEGGIQPTIFDAKADILTATAADTPARLAVGTNEHRLVAASGETTGLKYVADTTNYAIGAKGDLLAGTAADTLAALTVGANDLFLQAASGETTGLKWGGAWTTWSPTYSNLTIGNGTVVARYAKIGNTVHLQWQLDWGSTSSWSGASYIGNLPFNPKQRGAAIGHLQAANVNRPFFLSWAANGNIYLYVFTTDATYAGQASPSSTIPGSWTSASQDYLGFYVTYEVA